MSVKILLLGRPGTTAIAIPHDQGCDTWGFGFHDRCYYFGEDPSTKFGSRNFYSFDNARQFCQNSFNADLLVISDMEEQNFINAFVERYGSEFWIGLQGIVGTRSVNYNQWMTLL
jgi:hypothetical protein